MSILQFEHDDANFVELGERSYFVYQTLGRQIQLLPAQCPHRGGPLFLGTVVETPRESIRCPWHETVVPTQPMTRNAPPMVVNRGRFTIVAKQIDGADVHARRVTVLAGAEHFAEDGSPGGEASGNGVSALATQMAADKQNEPPINLRTGDLLRSTLGGPVESGQSQHAQLRDSELTTCGKCSHSENGKRLLTQHFLSINDLDVDRLHEMVDLGLRIAGGHEMIADVLRDKRVGLYFRNPSSRTRTSMFAAIDRMGGRSIDFRPGDLQLDNGESLEDTARALELFLDALVVRTNGAQSELVQLAKFSSKMSIVNALTKEEHPTQAIADLITIQQEFGGFAGRHVMYVGAFNNTSSSLLLACSKMSDLTITFVTPEPFAPDAATMQQARSNAAKSGARIECLYDADGLPDAVDVVYTARWQSMGNEPNDPRWRSYLEPRRVTPEFMRRVGKDTCIFMHDLPASRGDEVSSEVMEAPYSRIWRQSAHKATAAMVVLQQLIGN